MKVFVVSGLGFGDEGKGTTTHYLCWKHQAHTVVRTGGPQAFHRVVTPKGNEHIHSQFGSGTLVGAATHLSKNMVIDPNAVLNEGNALTYEHGLRGIFEYMTIHEDALVITPFHAIANRLRELSRQANRHGTVGIGVGETILDAQIHKADAIRAKDLGQPYLLKKLETIRIDKLRALQNIIDEINELPLDTDARKKFQEDVEDLNSQQLTVWTTSRFAEMASRVKIVDTNYLSDKILGRPGCVVFEGSQGVLLDRFYGFHPYTTKVRTIPNTALSLIDECLYQGEVVNLGVLRAYHTRHGAGPFVSESSWMTEQLPDEYNSDHMWQGSFRVGYFDEVAARYAIDVCGGPEAFDGLVITCIDRLPGLGSWGICLSYIDHKNRTINNIDVRHGSDDEQLQSQENLGQYLYRCNPNVMTHEIPDSVAALISKCVKMLENGLDVPIVSVSLGPSTQDKLDIKKF
jgi:adenylosuccinate synthase